MELLVVFAILGLLAAIVPASISKFSDSVGYRAALQGVSSMLRYARQQALLSGRPTEFYIDVHNKRYGLSSGQVEQLHDALQLEVTSAAQFSSQNIHRIIFLPEGGSSGGSISIIRAQNSQGLRLRVDWLSGKITTEQLE